MEGSALWKKSNKQKYLEIHAPDHYTLGRLEGKYLARQIWIFKLIIYLFTMIFFFRKGYTYKKFIRIAKEHENKTIQNLELRDLYRLLQDEMRGMADSIRGISYEDILLQNTYIELIYGRLIPLYRKFPSVLEFGCTSFGIINPGVIPKTLLGQNFDLNKMFQMTAAYVFHKVEGFPAIFCLRFGSMLSIPCGINEYGLKLNVNIVKSRIKSHAIIPTGIRTRMGFYNCKTVEEVHNLLESTGDSICYNLLIADNERVIGLEINPYNRPKTETETWIVRSNTFNSESLQQYLYQKNYSKKRQRFAENMVAQKYNDGLEETQLLKILSIRPIINRVNTVAYFTDKHFGIGRPKLKRAGIIPDFINNKI